MPSAHPWHSTPKIRQTGDDFTKFAHVLVGLYVYEWLLSLDFEWEFITRRRRFTWPMVFYFANRYCLLAIMITGMVILNAEKKLDCTAFLIFIEMAIVATIGLASINLSIRTIAIWSSNKYIVGGLVLAVIGQWSLIFQAGRLHAKWDHQIGLTCVITKTNNKILTAIFIYAMVYDLVVLLLTTYKLFANSSSETFARSRLTQVICVDGLFFFIVAFLTNLLASILAALNLNSFISMMFALPAPVFSTIVACRAVRRLKACDTEPTAENVMSFPLGLFNKHENRKKGLIEPGVHIMKETSIHHDDGYQPGDFGRSLSVIESGSDVVMETEGQNQKLSSL